MWPAIDKPYQFPTTSEFHPVSMDAEVNSTAELCSSFPRHMLNSVQPVLKMGYTENREKVNAQLDSVSTCFQPGDLLFFSDLDETLRGHQVIDVLAHLPDTYSNKSDKSLSKFQNYILQKELKAKGSLDTDPEAKKLVHGWEIDKFKFLAAVERAWIMRPDKEFYVFYETDT